MSNETSAKTHDEHVTEWIRQERITIGDPICEPPIVPVVMGWICPRCRASNAPGNTTCAQCSPQWQPTWYSGTYNFRLWNDGTTSEVG